jgi:ribosomal protein S9
MAKIFFDNKEFKKGELKDALKSQEMLLRDVRREEQQTGVTTSKESEIYFIKKGGLNGSV